MGYDSVQQHSRTDEWWWLKYQKIWNNRSYQLFQFTNPPKPPRYFSVFQSFLYFGGKNWLAIGAGSAVCAFPIIPPFPFPYNACYPFQAYVHLHSCYRSAALNALYQQGVQGTAEIPAGIRATDRRHRYRYVCTTDRCHHIQKYECSHVRVR